MTLDLDEIRADDARVDQQAGGIHGYLDSSPTKQRRYLLEIIDLNARQVDALLFVRQELWDELRAQCSTCMSPAQSGTRNGYSCQTHREMWSRLLARSRV